MPLPYPMCTEGPSMPVRLVVVLGMRIALGCCCSGLWRSTCGSLCRNTDASWRLHVPPRMGGRTQLPARVVLFCDFCFRFPGHLFARRQGESLWKTSVLCGVSVARTSRSRKAGACERSGAEAVGVAHTSRPQAGLDGGGRRRSANEFQHMLVPVMKHAALLTFDQKYLLQNMAGPEDGRTYMMRAGVLLRRVCGVVSWMLALTDLECDAFLTQSRATQSHQPESLLKLPCCVARFLSSRAQVPCANRDQSSTVLIYGFRSHREKPNEHPRGLKVQGSFSDISMHGKR